jgi:YebC/PmpR family DNA-binding regulatory protein
LLLLIRDGHSGSEFAQFVSVFFSIRVHLCAFVVSPHLVAAPLLCVSALKSTVPSSILNLAIPIELLLCVGQNPVMGAQWKQAGREANAQKKGQMTAKLVREIMIAAKLGGADPDLNPRLAAAVEKAKKSSVYRDTIERAIKKGSGQTDEKVNYELVTYEGFGPHKVPVVVECLTDSRNRTAPEIRNIFKVGSLGQPGSVGFFFNHVGVVEATHPDANRDAEGDAIESGAQEIEPLEAEETPAGQKGARFLTTIKDLDQVSKALKGAGWNIIAAEIRYVAKSFTEVTGTGRQEVTDFLNALDDHDDVHRVYAAFK